MKILFIILIVIFSSSCIFYENSFNENYWEVNLGDQRLHLDEESGEALYYSEGSLDEINVLFTSNYSDLELIYGDETIKIGESFIFKIVSGEEIILKKGDVEKSYRVSFTKLPIVEINSPNPSDSFEKLSFMKIDGLPRLPMKFEIRGQTSAYYDKKSYNIEIVENDDIDKSEKYSLFGMRSDDDWMLDGAYVDKISIRNRVSNKLFNIINSLPYESDSGKSAIDGRAVEVFLNGKYEGVYILSEKVDRKLLDLSKESGRIYKGFVKKLHKDKIYTNFEVIYPDKTLKESEFQELGEMLGSIKNDSSFENLEKNFEVEQVINYHLLLLILSATDNYSKNYFLAKNEDGKFFFVPWDLDATLGRKYDGVKIDEKRWVDLPIIKEITKKVEYQELLKARWDELKIGYMSVDSILGIIDSYYLDILESGAYLRNSERWKVEKRGSFDADDKDIYSDKDNYIDDREYIEEWLIKRFDYLDEKIGVN